MVLGASFTPKNCHVGDIRRTRFEVVYSPHRLFIYIVYSAIHKAAGLTVHGPFHDLTGTIPSFHCSKHEAVNGGTAFGVVPASGFFGNSR